MGDMTRREKLVAVLDHYEKVGLQIKDLRNAAVQYKADGHEGIEGFLNSELPLVNEEEVVDHPDQDRA